MPAGRFLPVLGACIFLSVTTGTMINVSLPYVGEAFGATESQYGWVMTGYALSFGVFSAVHGRLADQYGARRMYFLGLAVFSAMAFFNVLAPSLGLLIAGRILQGAGAAAMPALGATIVARLLPPGERGAAMGVLTGVIGFAASIGPFLGGAVVSLASWRGAFFFPAFGLLILPALLRRVPASVDRIRDDARFDLVGAVLLGLGAAGVLVSTSLAKQYGLGAPLTVACFFGGVVLLGALWAWIHRVEQPFIPPQLLHNRTYVAVILVAALTNGARFGTLVLTPILLTEIDQLSPMAVGGVLFPGALGILIASPLAGRASDRIGTQKIAGLGAVMMTVACGFSALFAGGAPIGTAAGMVLFGVGFGCMQSPLLASVSRILPDKLVGTGSGVYMTVFLLGSALGTAVAAASVDMLSGTAPWLPSPWLAEGAGRFSNAILLQGILGLAAVALVPWLPSAPPSDQSP